MTKYAEQAKQRELIAAVNLICDHVGEKLPTGWEIELHMVHGEAWVDLIEPGGETIDAGSSDYGISTIDELCVTAIEADEEVEQNRAACS